jgi:hypothetical protein
MADAFNNNQAVNKHRRECLAFAWVYSFKIEMNSTGAGGRYPLISDAGASKYPRLKLDQKL